MAEKEVLFFGDLPTWLVLREERSVDFILISQNQSAVHATHSSLAELGTLRQKISSNISSKVSQAESNSSFCTSTSDCHPSSRVQHSSSLRIEHAHVFTGAAAAMARVHDFLALFDRQMFA